MALAARSLVGRLVKVLRNLSRHGIKSVVWLAYAGLVAPLYYRVLAPLYVLGRARRLSQRYKDTEARLAKLQSAGFTKPGSVRIWRLAELCPELEAKVAPSRRLGSVIPLAEIDHNGLALPLFDTFWEIDRTIRETMLKRSRHSITIVDRDGDVCLRKEFHGNRGEFVSELEAVLTLQREGCPIPALLDIDFERSALTYAYIRGQCLRELLAKHGADIRDVGAPAHGVAVQRHRTAEGRRVLPSVISPRTLADIAAGLKAIHRAGYTVEDVKYGNIIIEHGTGRPVFYDFERAMSLKGMSADLALYCRDRDRRKLNERFGTALLTARTLRRMKSIPGGAVYAPIYAGSGIWWGQIWNPDIGIGRWRFIMAKSLPVPVGGRVLDLGANNGFNALQMLRSGASEVIAVEIDPLAIEQGNFLRDVYEWADNRQYRLRYAQGSHGELEKLELGRFDQVTAFCTLYYLSKEQMRNTASRIATMTDVFVQQANTDRLIDRSDPDTFTKASLEFTVALAKDNGFPLVDVIAPPGYSRPLVIARKQAARVTIPIESVDAQPRRLAV